MSVIKLAKGYTPTPPSKTMDMNLNISDENNEEYTVDSAGTDTINYITRRNNNLREWSRQIGKKDRYFYIMMGGNKNRFRTIALLGAGDMAKGHYRLKDIVVEYKKTIKNIHKKLKKYKEVSEFYREYTYSKNIILEIDKIGVDMNLRGIKNLRRVIKDYKKWEDRHNVA